MSTHDPSDYDGKSGGISTAPTLYHYSHQSTPQQRAQDERDTAEWRNRINHGTFLVVMAMIVLLMVTMVLSIANVRDGGSMCTPFALLIIAAPLMVKFLPKEV